MSKMNPLRDHGSVERRKDVPKQRPVTSKMQNNRSPQRAAWAEEQRAEAVEMTESPMH